MSGPVLVHNGVALYLSDDEARALVDAGVAAPCESCGTYRTVRGASWADVDAVAGHAYDPRHAVYIDGQVHSVHVQAYEATKHAKQLRRAGAEATVSRVKADPETGEYVRVD